MRTQIDPDNALLMAPSLRVGLPPSNDALSAYLDFCTPRVPITGLDPPSVIPTSHTEPPILPTDIIWFDGQGVEMPVVQSSTPPYTIALGRSSRFWSRYQFSYVDWRRFLPAPNISSISSIKKVFNHGPITCQPDTASNGTLCESFATVAGSAPNTTIYRVRILCGGADIVLPSQLFYTLGFSRWLFPTIQINFLDNDNSITLSASDYRIREPFTLHELFPHTRTFISQHNEPDVILLGSILLKSTVVAFDLQNMQTYITQKHVQPQHIPALPLFLTLLLVVLAILWGISPLSYKRIFPLAATGIIVVFSLIFICIWLGAASAAVWAPLIGFIIYIPLLQGFTSASVLCPLVLLWTLISPSQYEVGAIIFGALLFVLVIAIFEANSWWRVLAGLVPLIYFSIVFIADIAWHLWDDLWLLGVGNNSDSARIVAAFFTYLIIIWFGTVRGSFLATHKISFKK